MKIKMLEFSTATDSSSESRFPPFTLILLARFFAIVSVATLPLTNVLAFGQFITISFVSALFAVLCGLFSGATINYRVVIISGFFPFGLILISLFSFLLDSGGAHSSDIEMSRSFRTHYLLLFYACCLGVIHNLINFKMILKWVSVGVVFSATFGLADFFLQNFTAVSLDSILYRFVVPENTGSLGGLWRIRSTFAEPGLYAFYMGIMAPWAWIYIRDCFFSFRPILVGILVTSFLLTFSSTGYAILVLLTFLLAFREKKKIWLLPSLCAVVAIVFAEIFKLSDFALRATLFLAKYGGGTDSSALDRFSRVDTAIGFLEEAWNNGDLVTIFFGSGPGWVVSNYGTGFVNVYLYLLVEFGALGLFCVLGFFIVVWWKIVRWQEGMIFYSFFALILSLFLIQNYYELMVIFMLSLLAAAPKKHHKCNYIQI